MAAKEIKKCKVFFDEENGQFKIVDKKGGIVYAKQVDTENLPPFTIDVDDIIKIKPRFLN